MKTKTPKCSKAQPHEIHIVRESGVCVTCACHDEISRFNAALDAGKQVVIDWKDSLATGHTVKGMRPDFWLVTMPPGRDSSLDQRSWCLCNDGRWTRLLQLAGVERNPLFAEYS